MGIDGQRKREQHAKIAAGDGFFAALDQSGGSTPGALADSGIESNRYRDDAAMFDLVHAMRSRVITSPAFSGDRIIAAILFEQTMDRPIGGRPSAAYLWERKGIVPILKVDRGLADEQESVRLMKPIDDLDDLLDRAVAHGMFATKMRSVINDANESGVAKIVAQQYEIGRRIIDRGLVPILEPEVSIKSPDKADAERLLRDALMQGLDAVTAGEQVMVKITIPTEAGLYADLAADPRVLRVVALSGGYSRDEACALLSHDPSLIASFSRALLEGLSAEQSDAAFDDTLAASVAQIYRASVDKTPA